MSVMDDILFVLLVAAAFVGGYFFVWRLSGILTDSFRKTKRSSLSNMLNSRMETASDRTK